MIEDAKDHKPMLLVVTTTYPRWIDDTWPPFVHELSSRLSASYDVTVLTPRVPGALDTESRDNVRIKRFAYFPRKFECLSGDDGIFQTLKRKPLMIFLLPFFLVSMMLAIHKQVKQGAEIIHAHWLPWGLLATLAAPKTPVLVTAHGSDVFKLRGVFWRLFRRIAGHRARAISVVSHTLADRLLEEGIKPDKIFLAPMGVDLKKQFVSDSMVSNKNIDLVFVGRLIAAKGPDLLIEAMRVVNQKRPGTKLMLVGSGPLDEILKARTHDYGLSNVAEFSGAITNHAIAHVFSKSRVCVMPSRASQEGVSEGLGLVAIEALGSGCSLVSGSNPALKGMLPLGANAVFIDPENLAEFASALIAALDAEEPRAEDSFIFRQSLIKIFDWENVASNYDAILKKIAM
jgi:glycosyltransferase involved in cell wall biosynthesis